MVLKLDMEKAYDRMRWQFIEESLKDAGLPNMMSEAIMVIIKSNKCKLLWNGEVTKPIA